MGIANHTNCLYLAIFELFITYNQGVANPVNFLAVFSTTFSILILVIILTNYQVFHSTQKMRAKIFCFILALNVSSISFFNFAVLEIC